jgi:hypothetical protein
MSYHCGSTPPPTVPNPRCAVLTPTRITCELHCNEPDHNCKCCNQNTVANAYNNRIILHYIRADCSNTLYGTIYYDLDRDAVFFINSRGEEFSMTQFVRNNGGAGGQFRPVYRGGWNIALTYVANNLVFIGTKIYNALRTSTCANPATSPLDWALFFDISALISGGGGSNNSITPNPRGVWLSTTTYNLGDIVMIGLRLYWALATSIGANPVSSPLSWSLYFDFTGLLPTGEDAGNCTDSDGDDICNGSENVQVTPITGEDIAALSTPRHGFFEGDCEDPPEPAVWIPDIQFKINDQAVLDGELYTSLVLHRSSYANRPALALSTWRYEGVIKPVPHQVYLLLVQGTETIELDSRTGCSRRPYVDRGQYDFDAENPQAPIVYGVSHSSNAVELPLTRLRYIVNINRNVFEAGNDIRILRTGWYTVSYNIAHSGNVRKVNITVSKGRGRTDSEIEASHSESEVSVEMSNTSHSFPVKLEAGMIIALHMKVNPAARAHTNKQQQSFKLYPHKTWIHIKSID